MAAGAVAPGLEVAAERARRSRRGRRRSPCSRAAPRMVRKSSSGKDVHTMRRASVIGPLKGRTGTDSSSTEADDAERLHQVPRAGDERRAAGGSRAASAAGPRAGSHAAGSWGAGSCHRLEDLRAAHAVDHGVVHLAEERRRGRLRARRSGTSPRGAGAGRAASRRARRRARAAHLSPPGAGTATWRRWRRTSKVGSASQRGQSRSRNGRTGRSP